MNLEAQYYPHSLVYEKLPEETTPNWENKTQNQAILVKIIVFFCPVMKWLDLRSARVNLTLRLI
jgi:hypothetical protein